MARARHALACLAVAMLSGMAAPYGAQAAQPMQATRELAPAPTSSLEAFRARFKAAHPATRIDHVGFSPIDGLFEVVMGKNLAYVDSSARFAIFGSVFDLQGHRDLSAERRSQLERVDVKALPLHLAHRVVRGSGRPVLFSFADPQCGYCKLLEQTLQQLPDVTIYTFVMPLLGPESRRLAQAVACSPDPASSWSSLIHTGHLKVQAPTTAPSASPRVQADCAARVDEVEQLAASLGITGTPTLISADGNKRAGAQTLDQLKAWLASSSTPP